MTGTPRENAVFEPMTLDSIKPLNSLHVTVETDLKPVLDDVNAKLGLNMKSRGGGFHLTVISPAERDQIRPDVEIPDDVSKWERLNEGDIAALNKVSEAVMRGEGVEVKGIGFIGGATYPDLKEKDRKRKTAFVAFNIPALNDFRESLGLPPKDFHVTLGFEGNDLYTDADNNALPKQADPQFSDIAIPELVLSAVSGREKEKAKQAAPKGPRDRVVYSVEQVREALTRVAVERGATNDPNAIFVDETDSILSAVESDPNSLGRVLRNRMVTVKKAIEEASS